MLKLDLIEEVSDMYPGEFRLNREAVVLSELAELDVELEGIDSIVSRMQASLAGLLLSVADFPLGEVTQDFELETDPFIEGVSSLDPEGLIPPKLKMTFLESLKQINKDGLQLVFDPIAQRNLQWKLRQIREFGQRRC